MPIPTLKAREFARRLLAEEALGDTLNESQRHPTFRVCEKLRGPLAKLAGEAGYRALLFRALTLAQVEMPWLRQLSLRPNGAIDNPETAQLSGKEAAKGELALVTHLLSLLVLFIGEPLTLRLLHEVWPGVVGEEMNFGKDESS